MMPCICECDYVPYTLYEQCVGSFTSGHSRQRFLLSYEPLLGQNSDKRHGIERATRDSRNGDKWHKDGSKLHQQQKIERKYNSKILTATWLAPQHVERQVAKFRQETYVTPLRGPQLFKHSECKDLPTSWAQNISWVQSASRRFFHVFYSKSESLSQCWYCWGLNQWPRAWQTGV